MNANLFGNNKFIRVFNGNQKTAKMIPYGQLKNYENPDYEDTYASLSYYDNSHALQFYKSKSVQGITGLKTDKVWFDLDLKEDLEACRQATIKLIKRIEAKGFTEDSLEIYFSGQKGFHVIMNLESEIPTVKVKDIAIKFGEGIEGFDLKVYDEARIFRLPFTKHAKTGLYKTPLTLAELESMSIEEIKTKASSPTKSPPLRTFKKRVSIPEELLVETEVKRDAVVNMLQVRPDDKLLFSALDFTRKPKEWKSDAKWALSQGRFGIGDRHHVMMILAATCKAMLYNEHQTRGMLEAANVKHCEITGNKIQTDEIDKAIKSVFSDTWKGGQYSKNNDAWLEKYCLDHSLDDDREELNPINISDIRDSFKHYVVNIDENTIKTGIRLLDEAVPITIGMNLGILGAASSGKTAIALEILKHTSMNGVVSVIASLDMHRNRLFEKLLYKVSADVYGSPLTREELYGIFKKNEEEKLMAELKRQYENVYFYDRSRPSVEDISKFAKNVEKQTGKKVKLILIDYFERIGSDISDPTASSLRVANELQDLVNDLNVAVITLVQPNKFSLGGGPDTPLMSYTSIKGSSFLYQAFRSIVSIWRPFFTPGTKQDDKFLEMAILKNDLGELDKFKFNWDGKTGSITEMSPDDELLYADAVERKRASAQADADSGATPFDNFMKKRY